MPPDAKLSDFFLKLVSIIVINCTIPCRLQLNIIIYEFGNPNFRVFSCRLISHLTTQYVPIPLTAAHSSLRTTKDTLATLNLPRTYADIPPPNFEHTLRIQYIFEAASHNLANIVAKIFQAAVQNRLVYIRLGVIQ